MRANSLAVRLIASASLWSAAALVVAGLILTSLYRQTVETAFDDRLAVYMNTLVGALGAQNTANLADPGNLGEQRFEALYSGWYWQVRRADTDQVILASKSLFSDVLDLARITGHGEAAAGVRTGLLAGPLNQSLRVFGRTIEFDPSRRFEVVVAGDAGEMAGQIAAFRNSVVLTLAIFGIGLILATTIQIRWVLRPLDRVRRGLAELRSGKETRFEGNFPSEIEPLAKELNALLQSNQEIIERARTQVGNLAHALKTPLSVITNEARSNRGPLAEKVAEQAALMRMQVNHYLDRARIAARSNVIGAVTEVAPAVSRIVRAMKRIHEDRRLDIACHVADGARFRGEQQDLEEVIGNLVDNACKWARGSVVIAVDYECPRGEAEPGRLRFRIDDDGPGLTPEQREEATRRGRRLDETKPGSGLGLSIVADLVGLYQGRLHLDRSPAGGLRADIELPAA
ncbi:MAG: ATP-binding protein [Bauldia sp.]